MPRLSTLQWLILVAFLAFYGFAVFALTRDYYLRHPAQASSVPAAEVTNAHQGRSPPSWVSGSVLDAGTSRIPDGVADSNPALLARRADELFEQRRFAEATELYRKLLASNPADTDAYNDLGLALHYTGDSAGAILALEKGTQAGPDYARLWLSLGFVRAQSGDRQGAANALEKAVELSPGSEIGQEAARLLGQLRAAEPPRSPAQ